jgi:hypothetical protein
VRALKRFFIVYIILIYALLAIYRSIAFSGFPTHVFGLKEKILNVYLLYENKKSFTLVGEIVDQYLKRYAEMMKSFTSEYNWYDKLKKEGILEGIYVRSGITSFTVGSPFIPQFTTEVQYYIDKDNFTHYSFADIERDFFLDTIVDFSSIIGSIEGLSRVPRWIVLYDASGGTHSIVFNRNDDEPVDFDADEITTFTSPLITGFSRVLYMKPLSITDAKLILVASYPLKLGQRSTLLIGLILLVLLTILLVFFTLCFIFSASKDMKKKKVVIVEQGRRRSIISEIDSAMFSIRDSTRGLAKSKEEEAVEMPRRNLKYDGIHIKKA